MSALPACTALLPAVLCSHADILLYLAPSLAVAFLFWNGIVQAVMQAMTALMF